MLIIMQSLVSVMFMTTPRALEYQERQYQIYSTVALTHITEEHILKQSFHSKSKLSCCNVCSNNGYKSFYFDGEKHTCHCIGNKTNTSDLDNDGTTVRSTVFKVILYDPNEENNEAEDCLSLYQSGVNEDGVYTIKPTSGLSVEVYCDMASGGWTVLQRRSDGSVNFYRNWTDYVNGFGNVSGEHWIGLENIHLLAVQDSELYIYLEAFSGNPTKASGYAHYGSFSVSNAANYFRLKISNFTGDVGDCMAYQDGRDFSTFDEDRDMTGQNCAEVYKSGWWHNKCHRSNLNGLYNNTEYGKGINWRSPWGYNYSLKMTVMKIRRRT